MRFVVVDVETANARLSSICQIGVVGFDCGEEVFADSILVDPGVEFSEVNTSIHGMDAQSVLGAPSFAEHHQALIDRFGVGPVISYSLFDRMAFARACEGCSLPGFNGPWVDALRMVRRAWPGRADGYGLAAMAQGLGITFRHHDAVEDARAAGKLVIAAEGQSPGLFQAMLSPSTKAAGASRAKLLATGDGALAGEVICITGALSAPRAAIAKALAAAGAEVDSSVTKRTSILIVGDQDLDRLGGKEKSAKHLKAEALIAGGQDLRILAEGDLGLSA